MLGPLRVERRGATSKIGFDHVGEDGARLGEVEGSDGRVHLVETLAAAQKFGIDRADLVEHLAQFAEVGEELADFGGRSPVRLIVERYRLGPCPGPSTQWQLGRPQRL